MAKREMTASEMGRKGGSVTGASKVRGDAEHYAGLAAARWGDMTAEERSREMARRRKKGAQKK